MSDTHASRTENPLLLGRGCFFVAPYCVNKRVCVNEGGVIINTILMNVTKCDVCMKEVEYNDRVTAGPGAWPKFAFCFKCGKPIMDFLKKKGLIEKDAKK